MGAVLATLKRNDKFRKPLEDDGTASAAGGILTVATYVTAFVYLVLYVLTQRDGAYPSSTAVMIFGTSDDMVGGDIFRLPPTNCIAASGCWVLRFNTPPDATSSGSQRQCRYYTEGEALTEDDRIVYNTPDTVDTMHVIWEDVNFGLSYDVDKVVDISRTLTIESNKAATKLDQSTAKAHKVYKGSTQFHLVRTTGVDGTVVNTWTNSVTSEDGTPDDAQNGCEHFS
jgi:hypothetical protein